MAYNINYNSDIKIENLIDLDIDEDLESLSIDQNIQQNKSSKETEIDYPEDLLEMLNKQCYFLQSLALESTFNNTISLAYLNQERIILDIKLSNLLKKCDELKGNNDSHKELISDWLNVNLKTYDDIIKQLHGFFNRKENDSVSDSKNSKELLRLKEREERILSIQRDKQNLIKEKLELETMRKRVEMNEQRILENERTFDYIENESSRISIEEKKIIDFDNESESKLKFKNTIEFRDESKPKWNLKNTINYDKKDKQMQQQRTFNEISKDEIEFKEDLNKVDYKTSTRKDQQVDSDISSQCSREHIGNNEMEQKINQNLFQLFNNQQDLNKRLANHNMNQTLPPIEPIVFDGDFTKYKAFLISFKTNIEAKCHTEMHKLSYLMKYTKDEPHDIVSSCIHLDEEQCYIKAMEMLEKQYGNSNRIAQSFLKRLKDWKEIKFEDRVKINELYFYLNQIKNNMKTMSLLNQLNSHTEILNIVRKLPMFIQRKWKQKAYDIFKRDEQVTFDHLVEFMEEQSEIASIPVFDEIGSYKEAKKESNKEKTSKGKTFFTQQRKNEPSKEVKGNNYKGSNRYCPYCEKTNHFLNMCKEIVKIMHDDRVEFIKKNKLCFKCLRNSHFSDKCQKPEVCSICEKKHLTILHRNYNTDNTENKNKGEVNNNKKEDKKEKEAKALTVNLDNKNGNQNENFHSKVNNQKVFFPIVPVMLKHKFSNKTIMTNLALDTFSSGCFMDESLVKELGIKINNNQKNLNLTTIKGNERVLMTVLNNIEIRDIYGYNKENINTIFCKRDWPFDVKDVPTPNDVKGLSHLRNIPFNFLNKKVGILIGVNHAHILKPLEVVEGYYNQPYAIRYKHGWSLIGENKRNNTIRKNYTCHKMTIKEVDDIEENSIDILEKYCSNEFSDIDSEEIQPSRDDYRWKSEIDKNIYRNERGNFVLPLPFKDETIMSDLNNRNQALSRAIALKSKLMKNEEYFLKYKDFMQDMLDKNYAEKVPQSELLNSPKFYLTHHAVKHPKKDKIRIVYDASLSYKGESLNKNLLTGPNLIANLIGVLLKFRQEKYAFIFDIKQMFYQIRVNKRHIDFLRFFWFKNNDLNENLEEYRVLVHIFGSISSPAIANYVLKVTTQIKEVENYSEKAKQIIKTNFYVDDCLKSIEHEDEAVTLYKDVKEILTISGFNIHGLASNSRKL